MDELTLWPFLALGILALFLGSMGLILSGSLGRKKNLVRNAPDQFLVLWNKLQPLPDRDNLVVMMVHIAMMPESQRLKIRDYVQAVHASNFSHSPTLCTGLRPVLTRRLIPQRSPGSIENTAFLN